MRSFKTLGIVIKRKNFAETDRILTVYSKSRGKINVMAKGVRKINSRRSSQVELLNLSVLSMSEGTLPILTEAESVKYFPILKSDLKKTGVAFYICELIDGLIAEHEENPDVFSLLEETLDKLELTQDYKTLLSEFEQKLLGFLGFWPKERVFVEDRGAFIEDIMERQIKTKKVLLDIWNKI